MRVEAEDSRLWSKIYLCAMPSLTNTNRALLAAISDNEKSLKAPISFIGPIFRNLARSCLIRLVKVEGPDQHVFSIKPHLPESVWQVLYFSTSRQRGSLFCRNLIQDD